MHSGLDRGEMYQDIPVWIGLAGAFLAFSLRGLGPVGEGLLAVGTLSALTIVTIGWSPFGRLQKREGEEGEEGRMPPLEEIVALGGGAPPVLPKERKRPPRPPKPAPKAEEPAAAPAARPAVPGEDLPPLDLLDEAAEEAASFEAELDRLQLLLIETLKQFKVEVRPGGRTTGPVVTQYELIPAAGVKVHRISALGDDLALAIKAPSIRIVAPIPGKGAVGIEVPNPTRRAVGLRRLLESPQFQHTTFDLPIALGEDLEGRPVIADLAKMPHLLIAGATGSGKSVCINTIVTSLVYHYTTGRIRMLMIDPKMVELAIYKDLPHLRHSVVTDNKDAAKVFKWAVWQMQDRYELLHANAARNLVDFNRKVASG